MPTEATLDKSNMRPHLEVIRHVAWLMELLAAPAAQKPRISSAKTSLFVLLNCGAASSIVRLCRIRVRPAHLPVLVWHPRAPGLAHTARMTRPVDFSSNSSAESLPHDTQLHGWDALLHGRNPIASAPPHFTSTQQIASPPENYALLTDVAYSKNHYPLPKLVVLGVLAGG